MSKLITLTTLMLAIVYARRTLAYRRRYRLARTGPAAALEMSHLVGCVHVRAPAAPQAVRREVRS